MVNIKCEGLSFAYRNQYVLNDIDIELTSDAIAIIGENGSGKSTFVKLLKGILKPSKGDIFINGKNTKNYSVAKLSKYIGLVFQNPDDMIFKSKVLDEVMFGPLKLGKNFEESKRDSINALELVNLKDRLDANPYDLSFSERKLLSIASILSMDTEIVILDEPTMSLDYNEKLIIKEIIKYLNLQNKLVITILHDMDFVAEVFKKTIVFNNGKIVANDLTKNIFNNKDILRSANLDIPNITRLAQLLKFKENILNLDDFIHYINNKKYL